MLRAYERTIFRAPAAIPIVSPEAQPTEAVIVPQNNLVPPAGAAQILKPTIVPMAVAVAEIATLFVADICGLFAAAKVAVLLGLNGPSNADTLVGD
jgi:hypothetical protein